MDIEKPASVSEERPLIWILPLNESYTQNDYIKEVEFLKVSDNHKYLDVIDRPENITYPLLIRNRVKFDYHLRYQPTKPNGTYTNVRVAGRHQVFLNCGHQPKNNDDLVTWTEKFRRNAMPMAPPLVDLLIKQFNQTHRAFVG